MMTGSVNAETETGHARFSIAISGGASKGAYEAGLNWGVLKYALEIANLDTPIGGQLLPFKAESVTGASAGGINTLLSGLTWCSRPEEQGGISNRIDDNLFRDVWLNIDINSLLPQRADSPNYLSDDALLSRKNLLDAAAALRGKWNTPAFRKGCRIPLGVTVTRVEPDEAYRVLLRSV